MKKKNKEINEENVDLEFSKAVDDEFDNGKGEDNE